MANTKYTYSISSDFPNEQVYSSTLTQEINDSSISSASLLYIETTGDDCDIWFDDPLSTGDETTLDGLVAAHTGNPEVSPEKGGLIIVPLDTPGAPTVTPQGTSGSTTWGYKITAFSESGETLASTEGQTTTGNATLNSTNFNRITWSAVTGAIKYGIYRSTAGGTPSTTGALVEVQATATLQFDDTGQAASGSEPSEDKSSAVTIGSGSGSPGKLLTVRELTSDDNTVTSLIKLIRESSQTVLAGFGTGIYVELEDAGGTDRDVGSIHFYWDNPAAATLHSKARIQLRDGGSAADKNIEFFYDGKMTVLGDTILEKTTCNVVWGPGESVIGQNAGLSSNNGVPSITFDDVGESRARWNTKPPKNYDSGDLAIRMRCSVAGSPGSNSMRLGLNWECYASGDTLSSSLSNNVESTVSLSGVSNDELFDVDFTVGSGTFTKTDDILALHLYRDGDHSGDTTTLTLHIHLIELRYTGWALAGQAGQ